jgi:phospholipase/carboxylesterase
MARNLVAIVALTCVLVAPAAHGLPGAAVQANPARIEARPGTSARDCAPGLYTLKLGPGRTASMRVTPASRPGRKALLLALHGAGGSSVDGLWAFRGALASPNVVVVAPESESRIWNPFYGSDRNSIDRALARAFARCRIDPRRIAIGGFSDGAGNALTLGVLNGDLFRAVIALAPGDMLFKPSIGKPRIYIAHGTSDTVIPIGQSRAIAQTLRRRGYAVTYRTFSGGHVVPDALSRASVRWFLDRG